VTLAQARNLLRELYPSCTVEVQHSLNYWAPTRTEAEEYSAVVIRTGGTLYWFGQTLADVVAQAEAEAVPVDPGPREPDCDASAEVCGRYYP